MKKSILFKEAKINFIDKGKGRAVVLLHGFLGSVGMWDEYLKALPKHFRVIAIDLPGHGESECIGYVHRMELMAECVQVVMKSLHLRRYILIGHSMGGYAAMAFAELFPDNVKGICMFHSTAKADDPSKKKDRDRAIAVVKKDHLQFVGNLIESLFAPKNVPYLQLQIEVLKSIASNITKQGVIAALEGMKIRKNREIVLEYVKYPFLYIIGKEDTRLPWKALEKEAKMIKNNHRLILDNVGHMGFCEAKDETLLAIITFAKRVFRSNQL